MKEPHTLLFTVFVNLVQGWLLPGVVVLLIAILLIIAIRGMLVIDGESPSPQFHTIVHNNQEHSAGKKVVLS